MSERRNEIKYDLFVFGYLRHFSKMIGLEEILLWHSLLRSHKYLFPNLVLYFRSILLYVFYFLLKFFNLNCLIFIYLASYFLYSNKILLLNSSFSIILYIVYRHLLSEHLNIWRCGCSLLDYLNENFMSPRSGLITYLFIFFLP